ncbi:hypothetical protein AAFF_G00111690 [Aldrovandia affinis]|uniref:Uncharacterized protein n=1 Tax=Aldrovandia affinis TaxID=143900 RepID=A0AAD7RTE1_9TELE|nr:hypothetical protein AAFF_G00111690 [Aldrovandia affinis]
MEIAVDRSALELTQPGAQTAERALSLQGDTRGSSWIRIQTPCSEPSDHAFIAPTLAGMSWKRHVMTTATHRPPSSPSQGREGEEGAFPVSAGCMLQS